MLPEPRKCCGTSADRHGMCRCERVKFTNSSDVIIERVMVAIEAIEPSASTSESLTDGAHPS